MDRETRIYITQNKIKTKPSDFNSARSPFINNPMINQLMILTMANNLMAEKPKLRQSS